MFIRHLVYMYGMCVDNICTCIYHLMKDTQGMDPLYGVLMVKPEVFH